MSSKMFTKKRFDFFSLKYVFKGNNSYDMSRINKFLAETEKKLNNGEEIKPIECYSQVFIGISSISKVIIDRNQGDEDYFWLINFSKVDTEKESSVANVKSDIIKGRKYYASSKDEGPVTDTVVVFNPFNTVIIIPTNRDGFGRGTLKTFLYKTVKQKGAEISIIVDQSSLNKAELMKKPKEIVLNVAKIANIDKIRDPKTTAQTAQNLMLDGESDRMHLKFYSSSSFNGKIKDIVASLKGFINNEKIEASTLKIIGEHDEEPQIIDLVDERVVFIDEEVALDENGKLTVESMKNSITGAYFSKRREMDLFGITIEALREKEMSD
ncbi:hypothetical protein [Enterococcus casseliflavus]|uniref:hypothetical protein n=1 Tax=Enterococcus casseliflavus TaxID=37734 RepID=UPI00115E9CB9|nr:hypothetical protein [Enterococcus casseliflavus]